MNVSRVVFSHNKEGSGYVPNASLSPKGFLNRFYKKSFFSINSHDVRRDTCLSLEKIKIRLMKLIKKIN